MIRLHVVVEGQTEKNFIEELLSHYLMKNTRLMPVMNKQNMNTHKTHRLRTRRYTP